MAYILVNNFGIGSGSVPTYTWATKPSAPSTGTIAFISNVGTKGSHWTYDGTRWKLLNGQAILAAVDTSVTGVTNSETVTFQYQLPAGVLQLKDRLRLWNTALKSGTTDIGLLKVRMGTAGTTDDTQLTSLTTFMSSAQRAGAGYWDYRLETDTTIQQLALAGATNSGNSYGGSTTSATPAAVTITAAASTNALFINLTLASAGATDTLTQQDAQLALVTSPN